MKSLKNFLKLMLTLMCAAVVTGIGVATVYASISIMIIIGVAGLIWLAIGYARYEKKSQGKHPK